MNLENIMSKKIIAVSINDKVTEACELMKKYNIGFLPVEQNKHIIGVITDRDIACNCGCNHMDQDVKIENYMTNNVITIDVTKTPDEALQVMKKEKVKRLLVCEGEKIIGTLSLSDLLHSDIDPRNFLETVQGIWEPHNHTNDIEPEIDEFYL